MWLGHSRAHTHVVGDNSSHFLHTTIAIISRLLALDADDNIDAAPLFEGSQLFSCRPLLRRYITRVALYLLILKSGA